MARKRMIDPLIWESEDFSKLSYFARLIFIGMFSNADDEGRGRGKAAYLKSVICPYDESLRVADVEKTLDEIASCMSVTFYTSDGNEYYSLENWHKWQRVDKPQRSKIPPLDEGCTVIRRIIGEQSANNRRTVGDKSRLIEKKGIEVNGKEQEQNAREGVAAVYTRYENLFGAINPTVAEKISQYIGSGVEQELMCVIFDITQSEGKRFKYACAIIDSCIKNKILTVDAFNKSQEDFKTKKGRPSANCTQSGDDIEDIERRILEKMFKED